MKKIIDIINTGVKYIDESGIEKFIDFEECNSNWIQYRKRAENLTDSQVIELTLKDTCVGQRDICATPLYIEFFTKPFTRFEFSKSQFSSQEESFKEVQSKIHKFGWQTIDQS